VEEGYFEGLISKYLLDNPYEAVLIASPTRNLTARVEEPTARRLKGV
jgi:Predicted Zn-dependent peptidases, insulinase-like